MALKQLSARGLIVVLAAGLLAAGCTPTDPGTTSPVSPSASGPTSASATPTPTRTESAEEQKQREAFEAAEKAYRANFAEVARLAMDGGVRQPTAVLKATSTGDYLDLQMESLKYLFDEHARASESGKLAWVRAGAYSPRKLTLVGCEDYRSVQLVDKSGATVPPEGADQRIAEQTISVVNDGGRWKLSTAESKHVSRC